MNEELEARETVNVEGKNVDSDKVLPLTGSSLVAGSRGTSHQSMKRCFCKGSHWSDKYHVVTDPVARKVFLRKVDWRFLCLSQGHISRSCQKSKRRFYCKGSHNSVICENKITNNYVAENSEINSSTNYSANSSCVLLQTAEIILVNQGSQKSYVNESVKSFLKLIPTSHENMSISTFGNKTPEKKELKRVCFNLKSALGSCFAIETLCTGFIWLPLKNQLVQFTLKNYSHLQNLNLADSGASSNVDLLIGSDYYWDLVTGKVKAGKPVEPVPVETVFGWILNRSVANKSVDSSTNLNISESHVLFLNSAMPHIFNNLDNKVSNFWDLETLGISLDEKDICENFPDCIYKNSEKRYEAKLPFKETHPILSDNFNLCKKRLMNLYSKLKNDPELLERYNEIFIEQKELGMIEEVSESSEPGKCHYLPHHPVIWEDRGTTKVRIVFDASAEGNGPSLNECLYKGPQLTPLISVILLRFRTSGISLTADFSGGENSFKKAFELHKKLKLRFIEGLFFLRKWRTNGKKLCHLINEKNDELHPCKILGILWNEKNDTLCFDLSHIKELSRSLEPSKRNFLKILAKFYDPLGILQPILTSLKVLFQNLRKQKFEWDEDISDEFKSVLRKRQNYRNSKKTFEP